MAHSTEWYGQLGNGVMLAPDHEITIIAPDISSEAIVGEYETGVGYVANAALGKYITDSVRIEGEVSVRTVSVDAIQIDGELAALDGDGGINGVSFMGNAYLDLSAKSLLRPYIGAGLGAAIVGGESKDTVLAYQGMAGLSYELSAKHAIGVEYRYFKTADLKRNSDQAINFKTEYGGSSILAFRPIGF